MHTCADESEVLPCLFNSPLRGAFSWIQNRFPLFASLCLQYHNELLPAFMTIATVRLWGLLCPASLLENRAVLAQTTLQFTGLTTPTRKVTTAELARLPHQVQVAKDKAGKTHRYEGVALAELLPLLGAPQGKAIHGDALALVVIVSGADDYQVVFALPELDATFATQTVLLADRCDGQPLPAASGPYQVIVPQEKRPARWVRQVMGLRLATVKP